MNKSIENNMEDIQACRACLATDVKLYDMRDNLSEYRILNTFESVTGIQVSPNMPHHLCTYCCALVMKCATFQEKCRVSEQLLSCAMMQECVITTDYIRNIDRVSHGLQDSYTTKHFTINVKEENEDELTEIFNDFIKDDIKIEAESASSDEETLAEIIQKTRNPQKGNKTEILEENDMMEDCNTMDQDLDNISIKEELIDVDMPLFSFDTEPKVDLILNNQMEVITLTKEEQVEELKMRQNSENYKNSFFKCELCYKGFLMESTFKNHMDRHDPTRGPLSCDICHIRCIDKRSLQAHVGSTHLKKYICRRCGHVSKSVQRAKDHCKWHEGVTYICEICGATFRKSTSYLTHTRTRHPSAHVCQLCDASFVSAHGLKLHWMKAHNTHTIPQLHDELQCDRCNIYFKNTSALEKHVSLSVDGVCDTSLRPCTYCGDHFDCDELLKEHTKSHHRGGPVKCIECNKQFSTPRCYASHYQRIHLQLKPICRKKPAQTNVVCEICGLKCMSRSTLIYHQRIHSGEKPYQCTECPKRFSVYQRLQIHLRTHTGERPFKCSRCPKAFMHKAALNRHDRVHTGAKPYSCPHCNKTFSQSNSMKIHVRGVHLKLPALYRRTALEK